MRSRREFLTTAALAFPGLAAASFALPRTGSTRAPAGRRSALPVVLELFFDADAIPQLRDRFASDPLFAPLRQRLTAIDREEERRFLSSEIRLNDHLIDIARIGNSAQQMAFLYLVAGDEDAGQLAVEAVRALMRFPKWDYFLEADGDVFGLQRAPGTTMAVALSADWLGDLVDDTERSEWIRTMGERGCEANFRALFGMRHPEETQGWHIDPTSTYFEHRPGDRGLDISNWPYILDRTNLKAVPAGALAVGAIAYQQHLGATADTERWIEQAVFSLRSFGGLFAPDGSYDEGVSYANYTTLHIAQGITVLRRWSDLDLYDTINWPGYIEYQREMTLPTAADPIAIVNFGDAGLGATAAVPFWAAARSHDGEAQWYGRNLAKEQDEWALIWYTPSIEPVAPVATPHLWHSDLDWMVLRTGYNPEDLVVAMRSGGPANHEHADRNSLIVKCFGEQLVTDPHRPPYSFSDPAWMMRTTAGHSALLIDGEGHQYHDGSEGTNASDAVARLVRSMERETFFAWTSDATPAYALVLPDVAAVTRTVIVLHELPAVIVVDKVLKKTTPSRLQARFFAFNNDGHGRIEPDAASFRTVRPAAALLGEAHSPAGVTVAGSEPPIPADTAAMYPFAEVATQAESLEPMLITVLLPEQGAGGTASAAFQAPNDGETDIHMRNAGGEARCRIFDTGSIPEFDVS